MIVGERTLRNKIPETLKSGCLGAQRGDRGWSFPQVHACAVRDMVTPLLSGSTKGNQQTETSSVGVGLVKPVVAYGAKAANTITALFSKIGCWIVLSGNELDLSFCRSCGSGLFVLVPVARTVGRGRARFGIMSQRVLI